MNRIKICGLRDDETAVSAARYGADLLGFIFAPSRRQVTSAEVARIIAAVRDAGFMTPTVGVFVDLHPDQLINAIEVSGIDFVQLAGDEDPALLDYLPVPVIKVLPAGGDDDESSLRAQAAAWQGARHILLDAKDEAARGGTGKRANWVAAGELARHIPIGLAGGLDPENVREAIAVVGPAWVDVSTGVETDGVKDPARIERFIDNARAAFAAR